MMYIRNENSRKKFPNPQQESAVVTSLDALTTERPPMFLSFLEQQEQQKKKKTRSVVPMSEKCYKYRQRFAHARAKNERVNVTLPGFRICTLFTKRGVVRFR